MDDSEALKKSTQTLKQVVENKQPNHLITGASQPNPLDKEDGLPSAEVLAVRNSMNDVLAMYYALLSAHLGLVDANQSSALASQVLLHFDLIEKCGNEDVFLVNENTIIAVRNLAHHVWNSTRDITLVREILVDLCSNKIPVHRTDNHSIWRQALSEISFEYYTEQENWLEATKMISIIKETDQDGAQLRHAELLKLMGSYEEALEQVDDLIERIEFEESNLTDPVENKLPGAEEVKRSNLDSSDTTGEKNPVSNNEIDSRTGRNHGPKRQPSGDNIDMAQLNRKTKAARSHPVHPSLSIEHKAFIKSNALLLRAKLLDDETKILESLHYASVNRFLHVRTACLMSLAQRWANETDNVLESIVIEVLANGTRKEKQQLRELIKAR